MQGVDCRPDLASQDAQLHAAGCAKIYAEKVSGAKLANDAKVRGRSSNTWVIAR